MISSVRRDLIYTLSLKEIRSHACRLGFYVMLSVAFLLSSFIIRNFIRTIENEGLLILSNPLAFPLQISVLVGATYLALAAAVSIAREREEGTLETLFYTPVGEPSYFLGKYLSQLLTLIAMIVFVLIYLGITALLTNFVFSGELLLLALMFVFGGSCVLSFGLLVSTLVRGVKGAVFLFLLLAAMLVGIQLAHSLLMGLEAEGLGSFGLYMRSAVDVLQSAVTWISPFAYLDRGIRAVRLNLFGEYARTLAGALVYTAVFLTLSVQIFRYRGVRQ